MTMPETPQATVLRIVAKALDVDATMIDQLQNHAQDCTCVPCLHFMAADPDRDHHPCPHPHWPPNCIFCKVVREAGIPPADPAWLAKVLAVYHPEDGDA